MRFMRYCEIHSLTPSPTAAIQHQSQYRTIAYIRGKDATRMLLFHPYTESIDSCACSIPHLWMGLSSSMDSAISSLRGTGTDGRRRV